MPTIRNKQEMLISNTGANDLTLVGAATRRSGEQLAGQRVAADIWPARRTSSVVTINAKQPREWERLTVTASDTSIRAVGQRWVVLRGHLSAAS